MKYMNHLRKLALLSSLALSFSVAVQADGTLPLPMDTSKETLPLNLQDQVVDLRVEIDSMATAPSIQLPAGAIRLLPCATTDEFYAAEGRVFQEGIQRNVVGICKPKGQISSRTVVAVNADAIELEDATSLALLQGTLKMNGTKTAFTQFKGKLTNKILVPVAPATLSEAITAFKDVDFNFVR